MRLKWNEIPLSESFKGWSKILQTEEKLHLKIQNKI